MRSLKSLLGLPSERAPQRSRLASDPPPPVIHAIGDVHGRLDLLRDIERKIVERAAGDPEPRVIVTLGDYVDRGPRSAEVLDYLLGPAPEGFSRICLAGNHEQMMLEALHDSDAMAHWLGIGGIETLRSYGARDSDLLRISPHDKLMIDLARSYIPDEHIAFLRNMPIAVSAGGYLLVHAAIDPGTPLAQLDDETLLWARVKAHDAVNASGPLVVHGHTVKSEPVIAGNRLCIDTGAFAMGVLSAARLCQDGRIELLSTASEAPRLLRKSAARD